MADTIQIKRGNTTGTTYLADGELGYSKEEKALYIGDGGRRNQKICSAVEMAQLLEQMPNKLTGAQLNAISPLAETSDITDVVTAFNALIAELKASGIMKT